MKSLALLAAFFVVGSSFAQGGAVAAAAPAGQGSHSSINMSEKIFDPKRDSAKDIADAIKLATKQNKRILIDVGGNWCSWCHKLDTLFKTNKDVEKALKSYIVVKVNFSEDNKNETVLAKYPTISGYPHLFVLDKTGKLVHSQDTGLLETGDHHDPAKVLTFLAKFAK